MKALGQLLTVVSLVCGALAAATAYHASLDLPESEITGLTLTDNAGQQPNNPTKPLVKSGERLTRADVEQLAANKVEVDGRERRLRFVRVKEFAWGRWQGRWIFVISLLGMAVGALAVRAAERKAPGSAAGSVDQTSPRAILQELKTELDSLVANVEAASSPQEQLRLIVDGVGRLQRTALNDFVERRTALTAELGMTRMAEIMDEFSGAERSLNRAWTTASDGDVDESVDSLRLGRELLPIV